MSLPFGLFNIYGAFWCPSMSNSAFEISMKSNDVGLVNSERYMS